MAQPGTLSANPRIALTDLEAMHGDAYSWALTRCRYSRPDAADLLQDAYSRLLDGSARFDGRSTLRSFLFGVIDRIAREQRRRARIRALLLGKFADALAPEQPGEPQNQVGDAELAQVRAALLELSPRQRDVLELVFYRDCSIEAAADILGMPVGTARTHYQRGKQSMATKLTVAS